MSDRIITLKTPLPAEVLLFAALEGFDAISQPFAFDLTMASEDPAIEAEALLGQPVTVTVGRADPRRAIHAIVADFGFLDLAGGMARYRATLRPALWLLSLTSDNRIFQNKSTPEIIDEVVSQQHGVRSEKRLSGSYPPREYCVQYGESDLAFVSRLMEEEGIFYFFEHSADGHLLVLADDAGRLGPADGLDALPWQPDERANFLDGDCVVEWSARTAIRTRAWAHTDYDFEKPSADLTAKASEGAGYGGDKSEAYAYPGAYREVSRGDHLGQTRLDETRAPHRRAVARVTAPRLRSGAAVAFEGFPREAENGDYVVLRADYRMWDGQYQAGPASSPASGGRAEVGCELTVELQPQSLPFRPERRTPAPRMKGPQTAVVVGPAGAEIYTDKFARVKVQFHWDRLGKDDENSSCFIRVSAAWAGANWGFIQIPRIGQEVIVDFLEGDPDRPIITGRVYNAEQMPPYALPGNATQSGWKSRSSPGGGAANFNELRFEDKKGAEQVYLHAEKDHDTVVENDESRAIGHDWTETVGHDATQEVKHDRTETVGNDKATHVVGHRKVNVDKTDAESVGDTRSLTVGSDETIHVVGNSTESIDKVHKQTVGLAQMILVKAGRTDKVGLFESRVVGAVQTITVGKKRSVRVGGAQNHHVQGDDATTVNGGQTLKVAKDQGIDVTGGQAVKVGKDQGTDVTGGRTVKVGKDQGHDVTGKVGIKSGKEVTIEAADKITLKTGDASIELKKDGTITIKGKDVQISGSGTIVAKADGEMTFKGSKIHEN